MHRRDLPLLLALLRLFLLLAHLAAHLPLLPGALHHERREHRTRISGEAERLRTRIGKKRRARLVRGRGADGPLRPREGIRTRRSHISYSSVAHD